MQWKIKSGLPDEKIMSFEERVFLALIRRLNDLEISAEDGRPVGDQIEAVRGLLRELRSFLKERERGQLAESPVSTRPELVWSR